MVRFSRAKAAAAAPAVGAGQPAKEVALKDLVLTEPMPLWTNHMHWQSGVRFWLLPWCLAGHGGRALWV